MSMFPDCRNDDYYNYDFLSDELKLYIDGFDECVDRIEMVFDNADDFFSQNPDSRISPPKLGAFQELILSQLESERNEMITSLIDDMPDDVYTAQREKAISENGTEKYYDTRKFMITGVKEFHRNL